MNKYWLFSGESYYAGGGFDDFVNSYNILDNAIDMGKFLMVNDYWWHVLDIEKMKIVAYSNGSYCGIVDKEMLDDNVKESV